MVSARSDPVCGSVPAPLPTRNRDGIHHKRITVNIKVCLEDLALQVTVLTQSHERVQRACPHVSKGKVARAGASLLLPPGRSCEHIKDKVGKC